MKYLAIAAQIFAAVGCAILLMTIVSVVNVDYTTKGVAVGLAVGIGVNIWVCGYSYLICWFFFILPRRRAERRRHQKEVDLLETIFRSGDRKWWG